MAASMFADSASPMSSSSPSASSAPSIARPRSRCRPPGGPTSTSSIARSSPRVGRLPRRPSYPRAAAAVDATIVVARREGRNRCAWLSTRRRCRAARATNRPAATRATNIPSAIGQTPFPHRRRSDSDPPPDRCRDHRDGPGAWSEGRGRGRGNFILFFLFAWREASGYWRGHATSTFPPLSR